MTSPAKRPTGRPPLTDRVTLISAALTIGFPVTVGAVTRAVGVKYSTFYRHFPKVEQLTAACVDHRLGEGAWPEPLETSGWRDHLDGAAVALVALLQRYPGLDEALLHVALAPTTDTPPRLLTVAGDAVERLREAGLDEDTAEHAAWAVLNAATHPGVTTAARRHDVEFALDGIAHLGI